MWLSPLCYPPGNSCSFRLLHTRLYVLKSLSPLCSAWVFPLPVVTQNMCPLRSQSDSLFLCVIYYLKLAVGILSGVLVVHGIRARLGPVRLSGQIWKCELLYFEFLEFVFFFFKKNRSDPFHYVLFLYYGFHSLLPFEHCKRPYC